MCDNYCRGRRVFYSFVVLYTLGVWYRTKYYCLILFLCDVGVLTSKKIEFQNIKADAILYRKLQLLLVRLDNIFKQPHIVLNKQTCNNISVEHFYSEKFQLQVLMTFSLDTQIPSFCMKIGKDKFQKISYEELIFNHWKEIKDYSRDMINNNRIYDNVDLLYEIEYLINDSLLAIIMNKGLLINMKNKNDVSYLLYSSDGKGNVNNDFERHMIKLHHLAFDMYDKLNKFKIDSIAKPEFYKVITK